MAVLLAVISIVLYIYIDTHALYLVDKNIPIIIDELSTNNIPYFDINMIHSCTFEKPITRIAHKFLLCVNDDLSSQLIESIQSGMFPP